MHENNGLISKLLTASLLLYPRALISHITSKSQLQLFALPMIL